MIRKVDRIILFGTSHVAKDEAQNIKQSIEEYTPDVVCLELDSQRLKKVLNPNDNPKGKKQTYKTIKELGAFGFLFAQLAGYVQKKVGKSIKIDPGIDMKTAYEKSRELSIPISLIDLDIKLTMKKLSKLPLHKKISLMSSLFLKSFKKEYREMLKSFDLNKLPEEKMISQMIKILQKETPDLYKILIEDRNIHMSNRLLKLKEEHPGYIMAFVGAGHLEGMEKYLREKINQNSTQEISFSFKLDEDLSGNNLDVN